MTRASFNQCNMMSKVLLAAGHVNEYNTATFKGYDQIIAPVILLLLLLYIIYDILWYLYIYIC